jgi:rare lipoprotein A
MSGAGCGAIRSRGRGAGLLRRTSLACCLLALAGCGTFSGRTGSGDPQASSRGGGYYLDDGPGANPPANLDAVPDAVPRPEPLRRGNARPYMVMGRNYTPMTAHAPYRERGLATWYGRRYHGKPTSSGEIYDMYAMTGAHPILPIPSYARVTNLDNGRSVVVRINDRGPFLADRLIDLSYVAAYKLDIVRTGSARVEVEALSPDAGAQPLQAATEPVPAVVAVAAEPAPAQVVAATPLQAGPAGHYLQLGAFSVKENAERFLERMRVQLDAYDNALAIVNVDSLFRVHAGPYASRSAALQAAERIGQSLGAIPILAAPR